MSKKPQINLSKCKAGQKVSLRNGETSIFLGCRESQTYPYSTDFGSYQKNGRFFNSRETEHDIVAIPPRAQNQACENRPDSQAEAETSTGLGAHSGGAGVRTIDNIKTIVRAIPLEERLLACCDRIGRMAREAKGPRMSIPVEPGDDDIFITTTIKDAREELAKAHQSVVELNQRLIERQESFQAQLIRIEETWREKLREKDAQILGLREALGDACEALKGEGYYSAGSHYARALSSPPPPVVKLEDVRPLVEAITNAYITLAGDDHARLCGEQIIKIRDQFLTTYPQLS